MRRSCPNCNYANRPGAFRCVYCGDILPEELGAGAALAHNRWIILIGAFGVPILLKVMSVAWGILALSATADISFIVAMVVAVGGKFHFELPRTGRPASVAIWQVRRRRSRPCSGFFRTWPYAASFATFRLFTFILIEVLPRPVSTTRTASSPASCRRIAKAAGSCSPHSELCRQQLRGALRPPWRGRR